MTVYNIDLEVRGEGFEFDTFYFNTETKGLKTRQWKEHNIFILFERIKNNYLEVIKYLEHHNVPSEDIDSSINTAKRRSNRDFTVLLKETKDRIEDCTFAQETLTKRYKDEDFSLYITNEFYTFEQDNHIVGEIMKEIAKDS